ncbi:family 16 glycosylhydrolase [Porticoccaceae bacterium]|nr:family 16 glycosylhydrolase [Porticoccaceae bacterium]
MQAFRSLFCDSLLDKFAPEATMIDSIFKYCNKYILVVLSLNLLVACGGDGDGDGDDEECDFTYVNSAPVFTSDKVIYVQENQTVEFTINATDADGDELNFDMNGNEDGGRFTSGSTFFDSEYLIEIDKTGVVTFNEVPDYENPMDTDGDNIYKIHVTVEDGNYCNTDGMQGTATEIFEIRVTNDPSDDEPVNAIEWSLVWSDEFDEDTVNPAKWGYMLGDGTLYGETRGWGNNEKQFYTEDAVNSGITLDSEGNSVLYIDATATPNGPTDYASAKLTTEDLFEFRFGRVEARIKLPETQGIWPAFWMLGANKPEIGWPGSGEIDIMESLGNAPQTVYGTLHYVNEDNELRSSGDSKSLVQGKYSDDYHIYAIEWTPEKITWFIDNEQYHQVTIAEDMKEFLREHYFILNLAVGGYWPGYPDESTVLPQRLAVDYVRVYEDKTLVVPEAPNLDVQEETMGLDGSVAIAAINSSFALFQNLKIVLYGPGSPDTSLSTVSAEGATSILASFPGDNWGGLYFELDDLLDASDYQSGNLVVMLDVPEEIADFEVKLEGAAGAGSLNLLDYTPEFVDSVYQKYTIPLADFAAAGLTFNDLKIPFALWNPKDSNGNNVGGNVLIDNIYFEHAD